VPLKISPKAIVAIVTTALVLFIVVANWAGNPINSKNVITFLVVGVSLGGIYAILAGGLVVTYATTGIFNFAHAAIGGFLAFTYWQLSVDWGWPTVPSLVVVLAVVAPAIGIGLDRLIMRRLKDASLVVQLMVTVGLMLAFMGITLTIWKPTTGRSLPQFFRDTEGVQIGDVTATWHRIITVAVAIGIAVGLRWLLYRTRLGISMRAVVDSRNLAGLTGARPSVVSGASWALGCMTAGLAGILIAPETGMVVENLALLIVVASAAAAIAQLKSLPWAIAGGLLIGLAKSFTGVFLVFDQNWNYAPEAIPAVILFIALLFLPQARLETGKPRLTKRTERLTKPWEALVGSAFVFTLVAFWANGWIPWFGTNFGERSQVWLGRGAGFLVLGVITLSLVPLIGWAGQVSFANFAIAGIGAVLFSHFGGQNGDPIGIILVMLVCAPLGLLVALPALRLKGLYLALATLAFAEFTDKVIVRHPNMLDPSATGTLFEPLQLFGFTISTDAGDRKAFVIFLALVFCLFLLGFMLMRRTRFARRWIALNDSPAASATIGVNLTTQKMLVFALSGAVAGFAGCMLGLSSGALRVDSFPLFAGLPLVLLLAVQGVRYPIAAFMAVVGLASFPAIYELLGKPSWLTAVELIGPGLAAITMAFRPEGAVFYAGRDLAGILPWRKDAREEKALATARAREQDIGRDEIGELGLTRAFTADKVSQLDHRLHVADELDEHPLVPSASAVGGLHADGQGGGGGNGARAAGTTEEVTA
jgi:branched-chain amino acid transport system permease protein